MRTIAYILIAVASIPVVSFAETECTDRPECWPEGSAMRSGLLRREAEEALNEELQKRHKELVELISTKKIVKGVEFFQDQRLVEAVQSQQKSWDQYKNSECELVGALSSGASTWQSAKAMECAENLTSQRLKSIQRAISCVKKIPSKDRAFRQQSCMYKLAPLAVPLKK